jgi:hypothetical protein
LIGNVVGPTLWLLQMELLEAFVHIPFGK